MTFRPLPVMTVCALASLVVLAMLGNWQWQRYTQKISYTEDAVQVLDTLVYRPVGDVPIYVSTVLDGRSAWKHISRSELATPPGGHVFFVDVISEGIEPRLDVSARTQSDNNAVLIEGRFTQPEGPDRFTPAPNVEARQWFAFDAMAIGEAYAIEAMLDPRLFEPVTIDVIDERGTVRTIENPWANPALADPLPPARHLGYALTWWGIGAGLIGIYLIFHIKAGRLSFGKET